MLLFVSNGEGTGMGGHVWIEFQREFVKQLENGELIELDSPHYIHDIEFERIAEEARIFVDDL